MTNTPEIGGQLRALRERNLEDCSPSDDLGGIEDLILKLRAKMPKLGRGRQNSKLTGSPRSSPLLARTRGGSTKKDEVYGSLADERNFGR